MPYMTSHGRFQPRCVRLVSLRGSNNEMADLVRELVRASEKGANLARAIREEQQLFSLLVQEKDTERNKRFVQDFKTLADVLIQETVRHDLISKFPQIAPNVNGEESNTFTNALGESIVVEVKRNEAETAQLLCRVLDNNMTAAKLLASSVHTETHFDLEDDIHADLDPEISLEELAVWIDPLDSTAEYIHGREDQCCSVGIAACGLQCVTVLIGVYNLHTGEPLIGVVNQPFHMFDSFQNRWIGKFYWGYRFGDRRMSSFNGAGNMAVKESDSNRNANIDKQKTRVILISCAEDESLKDALAEHYHVVFTAGAGFKQLCVALGMADAYILSRDTTFRWDCCAPHALLKAAGGGVASFKKLVGSTDDRAQKGAFVQVADRCQITYHECGVGGEAGSKSIQKWCNHGGLVAYRDVEFLLELMQTIRPAVLQYV